MIVDRLDNWQSCFTGEEMRTVFTYLLALDATVEEGEYPLVDDRIFARVMSYWTKEVKDCALEAHRDYVDIQIVLSGAEGMEWVPTRGLQVKKAYDAASDVEFFLPPVQSLARVDVYPGIFALFFPEDAHMPQIAVNGTPELIKKVVVKIKREVFATRLGNS